MAAAGRTATKMISSGPRYPPRTNAPIDSTVAMTAFVSGLSRWYGDGVGGARLARKCGIVRGQGRGVGGELAAPADVDGSIGGPRYASASPTACSPWGNRATNRRLSAPTIANTMKNVRVLSIGSDSRPCFRTASWSVRAGLLERGDEDVRAAAGHAAEDDGGDRRRDDRGHDPANQPRDEDVGGAEVAFDEQQGEQTDERADQ